MHTEHLEYLCVIGQCSSLAEAAKKLYITSPALSIAIKNLEKELSIQLLHRFPKGVVLTDAAIEIIKSYQEFKKSFSKLGTPKQDVIYDLTAGLHFKLTRGAMTSFLLQQLCTIYKVYPTLNINFCECPHEQLLNELLEGELEFGFTSVPMVNGEKVFDYPTELNFHFLFSSNLVCLVHKGNQIAHYKNIAVKTLLTQTDVIVYDASPQSQTSLIDVLQATVDIHFGTIHSISTVTNLNLFYQLIVSGIKVGLIPMSSLYSDLDYIMGNFFILQISDKIEFHWGYFIKSDTVLSHNSVCFLNHLKAQIDNQCVFNL